MDAGKYRVKLRRTEELTVKPEAEQLDGKIFDFRHGWIIEDDHNLYPGEHAMVPSYKDAYPEGAPAWIASGDLS